MIENSNNEVLKKWDEMGFLENVPENVKIPLSNEYEKLYLFIKDLDDNKRFNHADLQELMDIGIALVYDVISETPDHSFNTNNLYKLFFNTQIKELGDSKLVDGYGELPVYLLIRNFIVNDEAKEINSKLNIDAEYLLTDLITKYYKNNFLKNI